MSRIHYRLYQTLWSGLDWLFPPTCAGCGAHGWRWCPQCQAQVRRPAEPLCACCGQEVAKPGLCSACRMERPSYTALRSWGIFEGPLREAIHNLKYRRQVSLGEMLSRPLVEYLSEISWGLDVVVPVPLGLARLSERGYNQAELLARPIALGIGLPCHPGALSRVRETQSQVGLSLTQRKENVTGAFQAQTKWIRGRSVLLVDDVATSSATLDACAAALLQGGARQVYGLTLARAPRREVGLRV